MTYCFKCGKRREIVANPCGITPFCSRCWPSTKRILLAILAKINADAEADMLKGNPVTGAHWRAIEATLKRLKGEAG